MENNSTNYKNTKNSNSCQRFSSRISNGLNELFYRFGFAVGLHPWNTIICCLVLVVAFALGFIVFHNEKDPMKLWIPKDSTFLRDTNWLLDTYKEGFRIESIVITAPNVLEPNVLRKAVRISNAVMKIKATLSNGTDVRWDDVCFKIPIIGDVTKSLMNRKRKKRETLTTEQPPNDHVINFDDDLFSSDNNDEHTEIKSLDPSVQLPSSVFCNIMNAMPYGCLQQNLLEIWKLNEDLLNNSTIDDILLTLNQTRVNPMNGHEIDFLHTLANIKRNDSNFILSANALLINWMVYVNFSDTEFSKIGNAAGTEDWGSEEAFLWETEFLRLMETFKETEFGNGTDLYYKAGRSYGDISSEVMFQDIDKIIIGIFMMFIFMKIILSKFNWIELRIIVCNFGLFSIFLAYVSMVGICSFCKLSYGPVHSSLPFLLLGLGVDDMFVMMSCLKTIKKQYKDQEIATSVNVAERIGLLLKMAGTSITITSLTDIIAFLVGASTAIPSLQSFCIYAAVGILLTYFFAITFFLAILTLDEIRIIQNRNSILPCIKHDVNNESIRKLWCNYNIMEKCIHNIYKKIILTKFGKLIILLFVICITCLSLKSALKIRQKFDPIWFIPERTYLFKYTMVKREYYPDMGYEASIYMGNLNYSMELPKIFSMVKEMENHTNIIQTIDSWTYPFHEFVVRNYNIDIYTNNITDNEWKTFLSKFLMTKSGGKYQAQFRFKDKLKCGEPIKNITASAIPFIFRRFYERDDYVPAMHKLYKIVNDTNLNSGDGFSTVWGLTFANWITDELIDIELLRNITIALICVMICTTILIVNVQICFWIFICVLLTLINVCGFMQYWNLTIDLISCIGLQLAVGLCIDYAAHVGHKFLTIGVGTRNERTYETVMQISAPVLYGGLSTLLALTMLASSEAHTFQTFFKIFLLVITFGLFHGLVFLPVILSLIGPKAYDKIEKRKNCDNDGTEMVTFLRENENLTNVEAIINDTNANQKSNENLDTIDYDEIQVLK